MNGRYYWVPIHRLKQVSIDPPEDLRDLVWLPAHITLVNGGEMFGLIPTRYAGSEAHDDSLIRLARRTEWQEPAEGVFEGLGQRIWATDADEYPILNVRQLQFGE